MNKKRIYPVPQKAPYVSAGMNVLNPEGYYPKAADVSPWYGVYLDYAATTPLDPRVRRAMEPFWGKDFGNPGSLHREGQRASAAVFHARRAVADLIGASHQEIIFTGSATEANNLALRGTIAELRRRYADLRGNNFSVSRRQVRAGPRPRLIVSAVEHESVLETARDLERAGVEVVYLPVSRQGIVDLKKLEAALNERTVLVSVMYANNEIGTIQPISKISKIIKDFKAAKQLSFSTTYHLPPTTYPLFHTDAVQAFQYLDCGVNRLGVDLMTLSAHKIYGPKGIGLLYARHLPPADSRLQPATYLPTGQAGNLKPIITGGGQEFGLRSGTENVPLIVGFARAAEIAAALREKEARRVAALREYFLARFVKMKGAVIINGSRDRRLPNNINVFLRHSRAGDFLVKLDLMGVAASVGSACTARQTVPSHVLKAIGADAKRAKGSIRFTLGRPTTKREVDAALSAMTRILRE